MIRFAPFVTLALLVNLLLFTLMSMVVEDGRLRLAGAEPVSLVDFIRTLEADAPPPALQRPPPEPPEPVELQPLPKLSLPSPPQPNPVRWAPFAVELDLALDLGAGPYIGELLAPAAPAVISARHLTPLVTLPPRYPRTARLRRIEGFVEVEFTVEADGSTADIRIVEAQPAGIFERAARRAIGRWRFQAHVVEGKPVAVRAWQRVDFRLDRR